jgi:hypothetical protein
MPMGIDNYREGVEMQISHVSPAVPAAPAAAHAAKSGVVNASEVSAALVQRAGGDGDGRTGTAALNDGDAAARAAAASRTVDVRA